ncbi:OmpA family protein [Schaalia georgiae]|nr:OmpA family protein [Schaalia georgiae]
MMRKNPMTAGVLAAAAILVAAGCSGGSHQSAGGTAQSATPTQAPSSQAPGTAVPGYKPGEIPPIPLFSIPPIDVFAQNADKAVISSVSSAVASVPGVTVAPASCDASGTYKHSGNTTFYSNGSSHTQSGDLSVSNHGDGSGHISEGPIWISYDGKGGGHYHNSDDDISIEINSDGSGYYHSPSVNIYRSADGYGTYRNDDTGDHISIDPNGTSSFSNEKTGVRYQNYGDGSGHYADSAGLYISNHGDGTATINYKTTVPADPLPTLQPVGAFPPVANLAPSQSCGTAITLDDSVLFDFGESTVRADAADTLAKLAAVLTDAGAPTAHVYGHTDSIGDDASNQTLSEQRAKAVVDELKKNGTTTTLDWQGFGETQPIAPNTNDDGSDNPAGRQANRRVEIYIPTF